MHQLHAFTISSLYPVTPRKMSTLLCPGPVLIIQLLLKGVALTGSSSHDKYTDAPLKVRPGQWNSVTFTVEQPAAELLHGRVRLYVERCLILEQVSQICVTLSKICQMLIKPSLGANQTGQ